LISEFPKLATALMSAQRWYKVQNKWAALWHCRTVSDNVTENAKSD